MVEDLELPTIWVLWKNDLPDGFAFRIHGEPAAQLMQFINQFLPAAVADLRENLEAKNQLLDQLAWFAANRTRLSEEDEFVYAALMAVDIGALEKTGFIVSDEFNGIVSAAAIASAPKVAPLGGGN
jgi:hypothetical protein